MKKIFYSAFVLSLSILSAYCSYTFLTGKYLLVGVFFSGICFGIFLMLFRLNVKNNKLDSYKIKLEKESIATDESSAKVKVLEQKISVLEKALENAINKK